MTNWLSHSFHTNLNTLFKAIIIGQKDITTGGDSCCQMKRIGSAKTVMGA
jgi:hypothetical protein